MTDFPFDADLEPDKNYQVLNENAELALKEVGDILKKSMPEGYGFARVNIWNFLGWMTSALIVTWFTVLAFMVLVYWSHCLNNSLHGTTNKAQDAVKARYVRDCENNHGVPNIGSNSAFWECTKP